MIGEDSRGRCADIIKTLESFLDFVDLVSNTARLLYEDIGHVQRHFNSIMHKFIFKFADVDRRLIEDVCESLLEYYGFQGEVQLCVKNDFSASQKLDLYPTLADLCELRVPLEVEGISLVPLLSDQNARGKEFALTQTPRPNYLRGKLPKVMG